MGNLNIEGRPVGFILSIELLIRPAERFQIYLGPAHKEEFAVGMRTFFISFTFLLFREN